jgi:hypothetical protein
VVVAILDDDDVDLSALDANEASSLPSTAKAEDVVLSLSLALNSVVEV